MLAPMAEAFVWGLVAASTLLVGALIAEARPPRERTLGLVMGFGSGVLLSAVAYELVEDAVDTAGDLRSVVAGVFAGTLVFTGGDLLVSRLGYQHRKPIAPTPTEASPLTIVLGALLDGLPESAVLGLTLLQTGNVSLAMFAAVLISNLPEGIAATAGLRTTGWSVPSVVALWSGIALASAAAAGLGFALLDGASPELLAFILAFAGGAVLTMLATSMMPEAYQHAGRSVGVLTSLGFTLAFAITWLQ
jgi:ZIP family zinc transporter